MAAPEPLTPVTPVLATRRVAVEIKADAEEAELIGLEEVLRGGGLKAPHLSDDKDEDEDEDEENEDEEDEEEGEGDDDDDGDDGRDGEYEYDREEYQTTLRKGGVVAVEMERAVGAGPRVYDDEGRLVLAEGEEPPKEQLGPFGLPIIAPAQPLEQQPPSSAASASANGTTTAKPTSNGAASLQSMFVPPTATATTAPSSASATATASSSTDEEHGSPFFRFFFFAGFSFPIDTYDVIISFCVCQARPS